ncbi:unnamed protein product [Symbiodinium microadriaticum]|nr:unnamed protein product [Symbiodinium sp. KB8]CAE7415028.1 unnamed protein product [Symbiodinium microadriaticum]
MQRRSHSGMGVPGRTSRLIRMWGLWVGITQCCRSETLIARSATRFALQDIGRRESRSSPVPGSWIGAGIFSRSLSL